MTTAAVPSAFTTAQRIRIVVIGTVVPLLVAAVGIAMMLSFDDLPDPIAIHWGVSDVPNGFGSVAGSAAPVGGIVAVISLLTAVVVVPLRAGAARSYVPSAFVATSVWLSVFLTVGIGGTVAMQRGLVDATQAGSPVMPMLLGLVVAFIAGAIAWVLVPRAAVTEPVEYDAPEFALSADERVLWTRSARPAPFVAVIVLAATLATMAAAVVAGVTGEGISIAIAPAAIVLLSATMLFWRVRIDGAGFVARSALGLPRFRYPLASIAIARAIDLIPFQQFGGWGIRFGSGGRLGVVLRSGEALEIERTDGRIFVITVDDANAAAALVNGLVARRDLPTA